MSRHDLSPKPAWTDYTITVGWDRPLGTYFAQVFHKDREPAEPPHRTPAATAARWLADLLRLPASWRPAEPVHIWLGADGTRIHRPDEILRAVEPYAHISTGLWRVLALDKAREGRRYH